MLSAASDGRDRSPNAQLIRCASCDSSSSAARSSSGVTWRREALARGHEVTVFHRGRHGADLFPATPSTSSATAAATCPRSRAARGTWPSTPRATSPPTSRRRSALLAAAGVEHLAFVSTCNVYPSWPAEPVSEETPVWTEGDDYGPNKAASEREAEAALPGRVAASCAPACSAARTTTSSGCRGGCGASAAAARCSPPATRTARSSSSTPATSPPGSSTSASAAAARDVYNATAPAGPHDDARRPRSGGRRDRLGRAADLGARRGARRRGRRRPVDRGAAVAAGGRGPGDVAGRRARAEAAGLRCRPIAETVADVWAWLRPAAPRPRAPDWLSPPAATGMTRRARARAARGVARRGQAAAAATPTRSCRAACS